MSEICISESNPQLNEQVSFGAPSYIWILPPTSPTPNNQSIALIGGPADVCWAEIFVHFRSRNIPYIAMHLWKKLDCPTAPAGELQRQPGSSVSWINMDFRVSRPKFLSPQFFSTLAEITPTTSLCLLWQKQRRQTQSLWFIISSDAHVSFGRDIRYNIIWIPIYYIILLLYYIDIEIRQSANGNNHFSSMLWFTLSAHWSIGSSPFALKLQTPDTSHSEGPETEGNSGRRDYFS